MKTSIYILELVGGFYYIGSSNDPDRRISQHFCGNGSAFTKKYKPVHIYSLERDVSIFLEDTRTLEFMYKYGINNVRGGCYPNILLSGSQYREIESKIRWATGKCSVCGSSDHLMNQCNSNRDKATMSTINARMLIMNRNRPVMNFKETNFSGVNFVDLYRGNLRFVNVDLSRSDFTGCNLSNVSFEHCILNGVKF